MLTMASWSNRPWKLQGTIPASWTIWSSVRVSAAKELVASEYQDHLPGNHDRWGQPKCLERAFSKPACRGVAGT